jgi:hypothetical protein
MTKTIAPDVAAYLGTALWSSTGDDDRPLDATYSVEDFAPEALIDAANDIARFRHLAGDVYALAQEYTGYDDARFMHDLWLTQNGHGAGFWDGDYGPYGDALTRASKVGTSDVYVGDDGLLYIA